MEGPLSDTGSNFHVSQVINQDGGWSWDLLASLLPTELLEHIRSIPLPLSNEVKDEIFWSPTPDGKFTVKFAFQIQQPPPEPDEARWRWVWKIPCLERIRMHMSPSPDCPRCVGIEESLSHIQRMSNCMRHVEQVRNYSTGIFQFPNSSMDKEQCCNQATNKPGPDAMVPHIPWHDLAAVEGKE